MAGESSIIRSALDRIKNMGVLTPESRAVQADIAAQRAMRYDRFMEAVPGAKGVFNLAPNAAPVVRLENGVVMTLPAGSKIPQGAQVLNKSRDEINQIVYNVPKQYSTEAAVGAGAVGAGVPAAIAAGAAGGPYEEPREGTMPFSYSGMGDVQPIPAQMPQPVLRQPNEPRNWPAYTPPVDLASIQPGEHSARAEEGPQQPYGDIYQPNEPRRFPTIDRALNVAGRSGANVSAAPEQARPTPEPSALASLIRGRFGEAGKGNPMDDRLTAAQEARDRMGEGRASGGSVDGKAGGKDAALHKALEIIHHLISTR